MTIEEMKKQDDGRLISICAIKDEGKWYYRCIMNIHPYRSREIDIKTFNHFMQYCSPVVLQETDDFKMYESKKPDDF